MDTSDPDIVFDDAGVCNHCKQYDRLVNKYVPTGDAAKAQLAQIAAEIKKSGKGKEYDCIIGVSGGVDSTYVAYKVAELGLRPLAVHLDNGWDSELAVKNIENTLKKLNIELYTHVIDWEEFKDLQLSFLKASTPDAEIPSDHAIVSIMYNMARKYKLTYVVIGCNYRTETHLPPAWSQGHGDWKYIQSVHKKFGTIPLRTFPHRGIITDFLDRKSLRQVDILNYVDYNKKQAMVVLQDKLGWKYYGGKHFESIYTRFYQGYILPTKFGFDKRKMHLSSLICSGEISRKEALVELAKPPYPKELQEEDKAYVIKKFNLSEQEFESIMNLPVKTYWDYPSYGNMKRLPFIKPARSFLKSLLKK
jgi:N-acetyl sugar amidotransferase